MLKRILTLAVIAILSAAIVGLGSPAAAFAGSCISAQAPTDGQRITLEGEGETPETEGVVSGRLFDSDGVLLLQVEEEFPSRFSGKFKLSGQRNLAPGTYTWSVRTQSFNGAPLAAPKLSCKATDSGRSIKEGSVRYVDTVECTFTVENGL